MDAVTRDWLVVGCSLTSLCASLSVPAIVYLSKVYRAQNMVRIARRKTYAAQLGLAARARDRFQSAAVRQKLQRLRPENPELSVQIDEDLSDGWAALEELGRRIQDDLLICSHKIVSLISETKAKHFYNAESLFRVYGHAALDIDALQKHAQDLTERLKQRYRREIGLNGQH